VAHDFSKHAQLLMTAGILQPFGDCGERSIRARKNELIVMRLAIRLGIIATAAFFAITAFAATVTVAAQASHPPRAQSLIQPDRFDNE
jgi:hypothetical protein